MVGAREEVGSVVLYTMGYQGRSAEDLPSLLQDAGITKVLDVRELPLSRKPGLSKTPLSSMLARHGVDYEHRRELGTPKSLRDWLRKGASWDAFAEVFSARLASLGWELDQVLMDLSGGDVLCLLCYEADPSQCHRSLVAEAVQERAARELSVRHL